MRKVLIFLALLLVCSCKKPEPEFYIKGKPYYTETHCIDSRTSTTYGFRMGIGFNGKYGYSYGPITKTVCYETRTDTIEIKP